jgi:hypothetical protein
VPFYDFAHDPYLTSCQTRVYDLLRATQERDEIVLCPDCLLPMARVWTVSSQHRAAEDNIPGGLWLENYGPEPIQVFSHTERKRLLKVGLDGKKRRDKTTGQEYELQEMVRHTPVPGTGKSPHTVDWSAGSIDAQTLENARVLVSRPGARGENGRDPEDVENDPASVHSSPLLRLFNETQTLVRK